MTSTTEASRGTAKGRWLEGIVPPVCTPLTPDLEVDTASFERHLSFQLEAGVHGIFVLGSSSEVAFLTDAQRAKVIEVAVKVVGGQVPVLAGSIDTSTGRVLDQAQRAKDLGADAIVVTAPFYTWAPHRAEVERHYRIIKERIGLPLVAYDIPIAVNSKLETSLLLELASDGVLQAAKDSSGDFPGLRSLITGSRPLEEFSVFTGSELVIDAVMLFGADGAVPGLCNVDPHGYVALYETCKKGDWAAAKEQQERLVRVFAVTAQADRSKKGPNSAGLGGFKTSLMLRGIFDSNAMGLPQIQLDENEVAGVRRVLEQEGLL
ncbi:MAG: dihydrodipicolinate synthase [Acidimicrobiaceae bacterium]|nr:dihydrodipicolinate synthase [Acidimicrobiaceae bacterium]